MTATTLEKVREAARQASLREVQRSARPLPARNSPVALCVVRDESQRLPGFLRHHRELGVERFVFISNDSSDDTVERLRREPDVDLYETAASFSWIAKQGWLNALVASIGYDRWYMLLDADEKLVFDGSEARDIRQLVKLAEGIGLRRVRGFLLDTYPAGPLLAPESPSSAPLFDGAGYRERVTPEIPSVRGGVRARVFGSIHPDFRPELTKYPLFHINADEVLENPHFIWPYPENFRSPRLVALLHDKFSGDFSLRLADALQRKSHWNDSFEYRCYEDALVRNPDLRLTGTSTCAYRGTGQLASLGLIVSPDWTAAAPAPAHSSAPMSSQAPAALRGAKDGIGLVTLNQALKLDNGYAHLDISVSRIHSHGALWPTLRFKLARFQGQASLEFRNSPDWPEFFDPWPGQDEDKHGRLFHLTQARLPDAARQFAGAQPGRVLEALLRFLPEIVDVGLRQAQEGLPEAEWLAAAAGLSAAWPAADADGKTVAEPVAAAPVVAPMPAFALEAGFGSVMLNQSLALESGYSHLDMTVNRLRSRDGAWPSLRFKLARFQGAANLEFRNSPDWPQVFDPWPGYEQDQHGDFFKLTEAELPGVARHMAAAQFGLVLSALFEYLPAVVEAAWRQTGEKDVPESEWLAAAERLCAAWSGGVRDAIGKAPTRAADAPPAIR